MNVQEYKAPDSVGRVQIAGLAIGGAALVATIFAAISSPEKFYQSYLFSYLLVLGLTLGSLGLLMLQHLTGGHWGIIIRRPLEAASRNFWLILLMFVPIVFGMKSLYRAWLDPEKLKAEPLSAYQQTYLTTGGFLGRAVLYFAIWGALVWVFNSWSREQDQNREDRALRRRFKLLAGPGIILVYPGHDICRNRSGDVLSPHWASTIYGFIFVGAQAITAMSFMIIVVQFSRERTPTPNHSEASSPRSGQTALRFQHALGLFRFLSTVDHLVRQSARRDFLLPHALVWRLGRRRSDRLLFSFALPFLVLLSRDVKRQRWLDHQGRYLDDRIPPRRSLLDDAAGIYFQRPS